MPNPNPTHGKTYAFLLDQLQNWWGTLTNPFRVQSVGVTDVNVVSGSSVGGTSSNFGAAFPAIGTAIGVKDSTGNMAGAKTDASGNLLVNVAAGGAGGGAVTVADGADVTQGATTDAAVVTDTTGTLSGKLRGLVKILADVWNSTTHALGVTFSNTTIAVTQGTAANLNATVTGSVTANAGTNLNTSALALESGGNLAASKADLDTIAGAVSASKMAVSGTVTTTPPSHASTDVDQIGGQAPALNAGTASAGTPRVVQATAAVLNVTQPSVLVSSTLVLAANVNRIKARIINTTTNPVWIGPTNPATVGNGAYIPGIPGYPWTTRYEGALYAIATGGTALVTVDEEASA